MEQYIKKSAVVAEIEKRYNEYTSSILKHYDACKEAKAQELGKILTILDTLEVKEVYLSNSFDATVCKIGSTYLKEMDRDAIAKALEPYEDGDKVKVIIIAQKGE